MNFGIYEAILMKLGGNLSNHIKMGKKQKRRENSKIGAKIQKNQLCRLLEAIIMVVEVGTTLELF